MTSTISNANPLGMFEQQSKVGTPNQQGSCKYDSENQEYTIMGAGVNVGGEQDDFHFVWRRITGDFIVTARARFVGSSTETPGKLGWMLRSSLADTVANVNTAIYSAGPAALQFRRAQGKTTEEIRFSTIAPDVIQLERKGNTFIMSVAHYGEPFVTEQIEGLELGTELYVGLYVCSGNDAVKEQAVFDNVRITIPTSSTVEPSPHNLGSNLEILDLASGKRRIVYSSEETFEAPNWTPDGQALIYNSKGRLYRFDLSTLTPTVIDTGAATRNNNDHLISPDGTLLGVSNHSEEDGGQSAIYILPINGGTPRRVTPLVPSYLHGWSPDGKFLAYCGARDGIYDIYTISVNGDEETRLTNTPGLDDGPEYSPDGKYIYFNSSRSGTMQIWRMYPDGNEQKQITNDEYNNWFAHFAPDGQKFVFLTYIKDVEPVAHPPNKHVYLRLMPADGGQAAVVAYLYGGQGTINVPSWSPDGSRIAFVSYSGTI